MGASAVGSNPIIPIDYILKVMDIISEQEFKDNKEEVLRRVEEGEMIGVMLDNGKATMLLPETDELIKMYRDQNDEAS